MSPRVVKEKIGIFTRTQQEFDLTNSTDTAAFVDSFKRRNEAASDSNLQRIEQFAWAVLKAAGLPATWAELGDVPAARWTANGKIAHDVVAVVRDARHFDYHAKPDTARAFNAGLVLGVLHAQLGANFAFEKDVVGREKSNAALPKKTKTVSKRQAIEALETTSSVAAAAAILGISEQWLRKIVPKDDRKSARAAKAKRRT